MSVNIYNANQDTLTRVDGGAVDEHTKIISIDTSTIATWMKEYTNTDDLSTYREILLCENDTNTLKGFTAIMSIPASFFRDGSLSSNSGVFRVASGDKVLFRYNPSTHSFQMSNPNSTTLYAYINIYGIK